MSPDKNLVDQLLQLEREYSSTVVPLFAKANVVEGNRKLRDWIDKVSIYLETNMPNKVEVFQTTISDIQAVGKFKDNTSLANFLAKVNPRILNFLKSTSLELKKRSSMNNNIKRKVFVVHGRNTTIARSMFEFLRALDLHPIEWSEARHLTGEPAPTINKILDVALSNAQAIIVLMTPDDEAYLKKEFVKPDDPDYERSPFPQPRANVIFEAGMAWGRDPKRTILVKCGKLRPMSDISGIHYVDLNNRAETRKELGERLKDAGCEISFSGTDWMSAGKFDNCAS